MDFLSFDVLRIILLIIFLAFLAFYLLYGLFAIYHALKYGFKSDKLTYPALILFLIGSGVLITLTFLAFPLA